MNLKQKYQSMKINLVEKFNPAQRYIVEEEGNEHSTTISRYHIAQAYDDLTCVRRGVDLITDSCSQINIDVKEKLNGIGVLPKPIKKNRLTSLLNYAPNEYQTAREFKANCFLDLLLEGNCFQYFDGYHLYRLPAHQVNVVASDITYVSHFEYGEKKFYPEEIIWTKMNSVRTSLRGESPLKGAQATITVLKKMIEYQYQYFENGTVQSVVLTTDNILSDKMKERQLAKWKQAYRAGGSGAHSPLIIDGGYQVQNLGEPTFRELDFLASIKAHEDDVYKALGIPPLLIDSGNNSNIAPNLRLLYINMVLPLFDNWVASLEKYFGYNMSSAKTEVLGLRPELNELASYLTQLVNAGIISQNTARVELRLDPDPSPEADKLIKPANISGSALPGTVGAEGEGRPKEPEE